MPENDTAVDATKQVSKCLQCIPPLYFLITENDMKNSRTSKKLFKIMAKPKITT